MDKGIPAKRLHMIDTIRSHDRFTELTEPGWKISEHTLKAFAKVPREMFVPESEKGLAYADSPLPIGAHQTISQPYIVALMTQILGLHKGDKVLEVGTGSGYQAAILDALGVDVYTIEIQEELYTHLEQLYGKEYIAPNVHLKYGDGFWGWPEEAPFDAVLITAAIQEVPQNLLDQLKVGGKMVLPLERDFDFQMLSQVTKTETGFDVKDVIPVRFVPFTREDTP